ncbi:MAG TPA: potassium/proton antiporter [Gemmatimonadales bacterium]|nr:potassium/proton antiporter [Gemmatimonadales bacterium]
MPTSEPFGTALLLTTAGVLMTASVLFSRASQRIGVPIALLFLLIGMLAGSEGIGGIAFEDYRFAFRLGSLALALILFDGGLNTPLAALRRTWAPATVLATIGVVLTALAIAVPAHWWGLDWPQALVLGAVVSSTDAASVFAVLRGSGLQLKRRVGTTLELESGLNDPVAVILTVTLSTALVSGAGDALEPARIALEIAVQLLVGTALGIGVGLGGRELLRRNPLPSGGLYSALSLALALLAYGVTTLLHGSGFLAVYLAGMLLGNAPLPYHAGLLRVHDALAWLAQIGMFLVLGLLVFPSGLFEVAGTGLGLALTLAILVRPAIVALCLAPFRYRWRETLYIGWVGLRGAVPIVLATYPVLVGAPGADRIFHVVFFIVVVNALIPGGTVSWVTRRLGLQASEPPAPQAVLAIESRLPLEGELMSFYIDEALVVTGIPLEELDFPEGSSVMLIVRGNRLVPPKGSTALEPGDHVYLVTQAEDKPLMQLMFGRPEAE